MTIARLCSVENSFANLTYEAVAYLDEGLSTLHKRTLKEDLFISQGCVFKTGGRRKRGWYSTDQRIVMNIAGTFFGS